MSTVPVKAALLMEHLVTHDGDDGHGYSQYSRNGDGTLEIVRIDSQDVTIAGGDRDCASACISCYTALGVDCGGATYTGNMRSCMTRTGNFAWKAMSWSARVGDIYLNELHHAAMCISQYGSSRGDLLAQFSISERGTIDGKEGDQTGQESNIRPYYNYPWDGKLHYVGGDAVTPGASSGSKFGDVEWFGPLMARELIRQSTGGSDSFLSGQAIEDKGAFWAVSGGVEYGSGGSDAIRWLQRKTGATADGYYGSKSVRAHQAKLKKAGYYKGDIDGYHGTATNAAMCRALEAKWYASL